MLLQLIAALQYFIIQGGDDFLPLSFVLYVLSINMLAFLICRASPSEFVIPLSKYAKAVFHTRVSVGMRFRMLFETEESSVRRYYSS